MDDRLTLAPLPNGLCPTPSGQSRRSRSGRYRIVQAAAGHDALKKAKSILHAVSWRAHAPSFGTGIQTVAASLPRSCERKAVGTERTTQGPVRLRRLLTLGLCVLNELTDFEIVTLEAKCAACGHTFDHPSFGEQMYGHMLFCAENGKFYAHFDAISTVGALVKVVLPDGVAPQVYPSSPCSSGGSDFWAEASRQESVALVAVRTSCLLGR